jgi:HPt (histidine-containing phosphotransfer) domain-containing protein
MQHDASEGEERQRKYKFLQMPHIYKISIDDPVKVIELLSYALPILRESVTSLRASLRDNEHSVFRKQLHKLKGSLGVIEPEVLYHHAAALEEQLREHDNIIAGEGSQNFIQEVEELIAEMEIALTNFKR